MSSKNKEVIRIIGFLIIYVLFFWFFSKVLSQKWGDEVSASDNFYKQPPGTIDVLVFGASGLRWGMSPLTIWEETGITSYVRAVGGQQAPMTYYYFLESLKYQKPKLVVLDAYRLVRYYTLNENEASYRRSFEPMKMSLVKMKAFFDITKDTNLEISLSYLFPLFRYHTRWNELDREDYNIFWVEGDIYRGQGVGFDAFPADLPDDFMSEIQAQSMIKEESLNYYEKIIDYCKNNHIDVFLLSMPRLSKADYGEYLTVKTFAEKHQLLFIDYNLPEYLIEVGFNPKTDMVDEGHLNSCGAYKFSKHLAYYLKDHFDLPDRRQDVVADQWNSDAKLLLDQISESCP